MWDPRHQSQILGLKDSFGLTNGKVVMTTYRSLRLRQKKWVKF